MIYIFAFLKRTHWHAKKFSYFLSCKGAGSVRYIEKICDGSFSYSLRKFQHQILYNKNQTISKIAGEFHHNKIIHQETPHANTNIT